MQANNAKDVSAGRAGNDRLEECPAGGEWGNAGWKPALRQGQGRVSQHGIALEELPDGTTPLELFLDEWAGSRDIEL